VNYGLINPELDAFLASQSGIFDANRNYYFCSIRNRWMDLLPEEKIRVYLLHILKEQILGSGQSLNLEVETNRLDITIQYQNNDVILQRKVKALLVIECKKLDGPTYHDAGAQLRAYLEEQKPIFGGLFYNGTEAVLVSGLNGRFESEVHIHSLEPLFAELKTQCAKINAELQPLYELAASASIGEFQALVSLVENIRQSKLFNSAGSNFEIRKKDGSSALIFNPTCSSAGYLKYNWQAARPTELRGEEFRSLSRVY
jgi:hypothetical protein